MTKATRKTRGVSFADERVLEAAISKAEKLGIRSLSDYINQLIKRDTGMHSYLPEHVRNMQSSPNALIEIAETFCSPALADRLKACVDKYLDTDQRTLIERLIDALCESFDDYGKETGYCLYRIMPYMRYNWICQEIQALSGKITETVDDAALHAADPVDEDSLRSIRDGLSEWWKANHPETMAEELEIYHKSLQARLTGTKRPKSPQK
ncbi:MAG: hypothetical protein Q7Q73_07365 [Verrucomicrobiota bacterium JB024]|nr:hypothetical protein [Verrucomicrobiota bacterium JB024]